MARNLLPVWRRVLVMLVTVMGSCLAITQNAAHGQAQSKSYENREFRFAITPPPGWTREVSRGPTGFVVKFIHKRGTLSVAAKPAQDFHRKTIELVKKYELSEKQLGDLSRDMYAKDPGVIDPRLFITHLASERALGSIYAYELRTVGSTIYVMLFKAETIRTDTFYKVEMTGPASPTLEGAAAGFNDVREQLLNHVRTFVFLNY
jgi:hypothetical protein